MIDLHVHTARCGHAVGDVPEYVAAAERMGLDVIGFSDHMPLPDGWDTGEYAMSWEELPRYVAAVKRAAAESADRGGPEVLLGIEADWLADAPTLVTGALRAHDFDYVLGSVHFLGEWAFDDPDLIGRYDDESPDALWERYFDTLAAAAASGLFDVMAHPDLIKKFKVYPSADPAPLYEEAAAVFAENGLAIEVSSGGLRKPCAELYPSQAFLAACRRRGVPATVGSDAHDPGDVAFGWDSAREALLEAGYRSAVVFRGRRAEEVAL